MKDLFGDITHFSKVKGNGKRCSCCHKFKALKYFSHDYGRKDTYRSICKECDRTLQKESRRKMQYIQIQYKQCSECGCIKPVPEFGLDKTKKDGHRSYCMECMKLQQKYRRHIKLLKTTRKF